MAIAHFYNQYWNSLANKQINLTSDVIKMVLLTSAYTPNKGTHRYYSDLSNELPTASGYTNGGQTITSMAVAVTNTNDVQTVTINGSPTAGTFTLTFTDNTGVAQTTTAITAGASLPTAATVQAALLALSNIGSTNVAVTGSAGGPFTVTFQQSLGATLLPILGHTDSLTGGSTPNVSIVHTTPGVGTIAMTGANASWPSSTFTAHYGVLLDSTPGTAATDPLIGFVDFCVDQSPSSGTFSVTWAASGIGSVTDQ
jgi:hypothetical protein